MEQELKLTAINPFAVAEQVLGKKVKWDELEDQEESLAGVFNVPKEELFAHDSVIINPMLSAKGELLTREKAQTQLKTYLEAKTVKKLTLKTRSIKQIALKDIASKTINAVFLESVKSAKNTEWNPANTVWLDKGDYFEDVAELTDPVQGSLADCYYISALCSVAWSRPYAIINATSPSRNGNEDSPLHQVPFYNTKGTIENVVVGEAVPCSSSTKNILYASSADSGEIWPAVMEKAYAKWKTGNTTDKPNFLSIEYGDCVEACRQLIGGTKTYKYTSDMTASQIATFVRSNSLSRRTFNPMVAWTPSRQPSGCDYAKAHIVANHAYSILGWVSSNNSYYIVLRNPWGTYHGVLDCLSGSYSGMLNDNWHNFTYGRNGVFAMKVDTFKKYFSGLGVVK